VAHLSPGPAIAGFQTLRRFVEMREAQPASEFILLDALRFQLPLNNRGKMENQNNSGATSIVRPMEEDFAKY
jgi:hypothetical protein